MTTPTFSPADETMCDDDRQGSAEHFRRVVRNSLWAYNERSVMIGNAFRLVDLSGSPRRTLWRASAQWSFMGPFFLDVPQAVASYNLANGGRPYVRVLVNLRTNEGDGFVRFGAVNARLGLPTEATANAATDGGAPVSEGQWAVAESAPGSNSFELAVQLPVHPGVNMWWLMFRTDPDANVTPTTLTTPFRSFSTDAALATQPRHPSIYSDDAAAPASAPFQYVDIAQTSTDMTNGEFRRYTIPEVVDDLGKSGNVQRLCWEATDDEWDNLIDSVTVDIGDPQSVETAARVGSLVHCYVDGLSVDGSSLYELEDRQFGAAFRYLQYASGALTAVAVQEAYSAHLGRLPVVRFVTDVEYELTTSFASPFTGVPGLWRQQSVFSTFVPGTSSVYLGANVNPADSPANDALDLPDTQAGTGRVYQAVFAYCIVDTRTNLQTPPFLEWRARLDYIATDGTAFDVTGDVVTTATAPLPIPSRLRRQLLWSARRNTNGVPYGTEGLVLGSDLAYWQTVTLTVAEPAGFNDAVFRSLFVQVRGVTSPGGTGVTEARRFITTTPIMVSIKEA
jgi:hypothetical protein